MSALNQDYNDIEYIVSDDGSPNFPYEDVVNFIENHKGSNIKGFKVLNNKENVGTVKHLNNILKDATGDLFVPLAGDDMFYDKNVISRIAERYKIAGFKVLATSRVKCNHVGKMIGYMPHYLSRQIIEQEMALAEDQHKHFTECKMRDFASGSALTYEADFLRQMNFFDEKYKLWEDGPFINKVTSQGYALSFAYDIVSIKYSDGGVSSGGNPIMKVDMIKFNETDRWINASNYSWYHKRILAYTKHKYLCYSKLKRILIKFLYIDVVIDQLIYLLQEKYLGNKDVNYLNNTK